MKRDVAIMWAEALESGAYRQGTGALAFVDGGECRHCCLGVLCELAMADGLPVVRDAPQNDGCVLFDTSSGSLPQSVMDWAGLDHRDPPIGDMQASDWNDSEGLSFREIAALIREHLVGEDSDA